MLIVLEGLDKAGKTTQTYLLREFFIGKGKLVETWSFPDYDTPIGDIIRQFLKGDIQLNKESARLLFTANLWEDKEVLEFAVSKYDYAVLNRYYPSNIAYGCAQGMNSRMLHILTEDLPKPDLIIYLDIDPTISSKREDNPDIFEKDLEFQKRVRDEYKLLGNYYNNTFDYKKIKFVTIDVNEGKSKEDIHKEIVKIVTNLKH